MGKLRSGTAETTESNFCSDSADQASSAKIEGIAMNEVHDLGVGPRQMVDRSLRSIRSETMSSGFTPRARIALVMTPVPGPSSRTGKPECDGIDDTGHAARGDRRGGCDGSDRFWPLHHTLEEPDFVVEFLLEPLLSSVNVPLPTPPLPDLGARYIRARANVARAICRKNKAYWRKTGKNAKANSYRHTRIGIST